MRRAGGAISGGSSSADRCIGIVEGGRGLMADYRGRDVHFCATCVWIRHEGPQTYICSRLGYQTQPAWKFHCWTPRERYRNVDSENAPESPPHD